MGLASATTELCAPAWGGGTSAAHLAVWSILSVCVVSYISIFYFRGLCSIPCVVPAAASLSPCSPGASCPPPLPPIHLTMASSCQQSRAGGVQASHLLPSSRAVPSVPHTRTELCRDPPRLGSTWNVPFWLVASPLLCP